MTGSQPKEVDGQIVTKQGLGNRDLDGDGRSNRVRDFKALITAFKVYLRALALESLPITIKNFLAADTKIPILLHPNSMKMSYGQIDTVFGLP